MTDRLAYTTGLRRLADALDADPDLPLPYSGTDSELHWIITTRSDQREVLRKVARLVDGPATKGYRGADFDLDGRIDGLKVGVIASRDEVCSRVVTGTREVTTEVPDPDALAAVPTVSRTETVEDVEWICEPLMAEPVSA